MVCFDLLTSQIDSMVIQVPVILNIHNKVCVCQFYDYNTKRNSNILKSQSSYSSSMGSEMLNASAI